jgi:hypothetical protein
MATIKAAALPSRFFLVMRPAKPNLPAAKADVIDKIARSLAGKKMKEQTGFLREISAEAFEIDSA